MKFTFTLLTMLLNTYPVYAVEDASDLFKRYKPAVVKILIYDGTTFKGHGTGFFFTPKGHIVTNRHVIESALKNSNFKAEIQLHDEKIIKEYSIGGCEVESQDIDICHIKVDYTPQSYFKLNDQIPDIGQSVFVIGHPRGYDFTISDGLLSSIRHLKNGSVVDKSKETIEYIQVTAPISPGNSGGPIFDKNGTLRGMATWIRTDPGSQNLNFAISSNEIWKLFKNNQRYVSVQDFQNQIKDKNSSFVAEIQKQLSDPAWEIISRNEKKGTWAEPLNPSHWTTEILNVAGKKISLNIPFFLQCSKLTDQNSVTCFGKGSSVGFIVNFAKGNHTKKIDKFKKKDEPNWEMNNLIKKGLWENYKKGLNPRQLSSYIEKQVKPFACKPGQGFFLSRMRCTAGFINTVLADSIGFSVVTYYYDHDLTIYIDSYSSNKLLEKAIFDTAAITSLTTRFL